MSDLIDSASVLIIRDNNRTGKMEVLLVRRHDDIDFAGGAYVFPGGKKDPDDQNLLDDKGVFPNGFGELIGTAIREVYEESGMIVSSHQDLYDNVSNLIKGRINIFEFMGSADINYFIDDIIPFARWVTPRPYKKRFDTRFFLTKAPDNQEAIPDQNEVVEAVWVEPLEFIEKNHEKMMFPTIMNLKLLSQAHSVAEAMAITKTRKIITVEPKIINGKRFIDPNAGYGEIDQTNIHPGEKSHND